MSGYVPTHGPDCETQTYRTRCSSCRKTIFFFSCSCQSAVFFDSLGHPWPEHDCTWGQRHYGDLRAQGHSAEHAWYQVLTDASYHGRSIPEHVSESIQREVQVDKTRRSSPKSPRKTHARQVLPDNPREFPGSITGIDRGINMPKRFGLDSKPISLKLLGPLGRGRWHGIRVRHDEQAGQTIVPVIYAFMPEGEASSLAIREGHKVLVSVKPYAPPGKDPVWVITETAIR